MLLVCMKCVNCSILFLLPSMLSCSMFILCVLVYYWEMIAGGCLEEGAVVVGLE